MTATDALPVVCRVDLAPARVVHTPADGEERVHGRARVVVTADRVYVYVDSATGPTLWFDARIESFEGRNTTGYHVVTAAGDGITFRRSGGCMCGSQLKAFRPFPQGLIQGAYTFT